MTTSSRPSHSAQVPPRFRHVRQAADGVAGGRLPRRAHVTRAAEGGVGGWQGLTTVTCAGELISEPAPVPETRFAGDRFTSLLAGPERLSAPSEPCFSSDAAKRSAALRTLSFSSSIAAWPLAAMPDSRLVGALCVGPLTRCRDVRRRRPITWHVAHVARGPHRRRLPQPNAVMSVARRCVDGPRSWRGCRQVRDDRRPRLCRRASKQSSDLVAPGPESW
jgi:hypothetical protein